MRVKNKSRKKTINNSYETEPSSGSITSSSTDSNDESLNSHRNNKQSSKNIINSYKIANATDDGAEINLMKKKLKRIEDSSFFRKKIERSHASTEDETDQEDNYSYDENKTEAMESKKDCLIRDESSQSLKFKICSKLVEGETIYEMVSVENSSNAIDTTLSENISTENPSELSFNGKINNLKRQFKLTNNIGENINGPVIKTSNNSIEQQGINNFEQKQVEISVDDSVNSVKNNQQSLNNLNLKEINEKKNETVTRREMSPDLFDDYDNSDAEECATEKDCSPTISFSKDEGIKNEVRTSITKTKNEVRKSITKMKNGNNEFNTVNATNQSEIDLLKKIQNSLQGVPPPPSKTIPQIDLLKIIPKSKNKILNFFENFMQGDKQIDTLKTVCDTANLKQTKWSDSSKHHYYGIRYNTSEASEKIDSLSLSVVDRYVGAETKSSYQLSPSSAQKRMSRLKQLNQSPGSRLSHLAKRRAIFSSANLLQSNTFKLCSSKRQILLDKGKTKNKRKTTTPRRKTPGSKKKTFTRKTPTSSGKKKIFWNEKPNPSRETSKRALFQSPPQKMVQKSQTYKPTINPEIANRVERSKRALFSPDEKFSMKMFSQPNLSQADIKSESYYFSENSQTYSENPPKRMCIDGNMTLTQDRKRIIRLDSSSSFDEQSSRSLKFKSQSFCTEANPSNNLLPTGNKFLYRASSDSTFYSGQLTESHKKKLLWAVSLALQKKQISVSHPDFKKHASILVKAIKRLFLEFYKKTNSTSETMLRLSKKYVFHVIQGKTIDDIYSTEKKLIENERLFSIKTRGYICSEDYAKLQRNTVISKNHNKAEIKLTKTASFSSSENSIDLFNNNSHKNQESPVIHFNNSTYNQQQRSAMKLSTQITKTLSNSSSKNNLGDSALRENIHELRKSGQKNFTGKDQKNLSPYKSPHFSSSEKSVLNQLKSGNNIFDLNTVKAKRQISFDC